MHDHSLLEGLMLKLSFSLERISFSDGIILSSLIDYRIQYKHSIDIVYKFNEKN